MFISQLGRYTLVGGLAFLVDFGMLYGLTELLQISYLAAAAVAFTAGLMINYFLSITWVFEHRVYPSRNKEFIIFVIIGILGLGLNELCLWFFTEKAGIHYLFSKIVATVLVFIWNFSVRKLILFRDPATTLKRKVV